jgi:WD40 repeat protein
LPGTSNTYMQVPSDPRRWDLPHQINIIGPGAMTAPTANGERVRVGPLAVAADDSCIACTSWEGRILVWRLFDPDHPVLPLGKCVSAAWLADGSVVVGGQEGTGLHASQGKIEVLGRLHTWQPSTGQVLTWRTRDFQIMALFASPDGNTLALSRSSNVRFQLEVLRRSGPGWVAEGAPIELPPESRGFISACFVDGGARLITSMVQGRILIWDLRTREVVQRIPDEDPASLPGRGDHQDWYAVAATSDAGTIWTGGAPGLLHRFDRDPDGSYRETRRPVHTRIAAMVVLPDGSLLVAGAAGYLVRHFCDGRELTFQGHLDVVRSVAWTRLDGEVLIASGDRSGALRLWQIDGTFLREIPAHADSISTLGFSPDGTRILSGSGDGTARVWWTREQDLLRVARRELRSLSDAQRARFGIGSEAR